MSTLTSEVVDYLPRSITSFPLPLGADHPLVAYPDIGVLVVDRVAAVQLATQEWLALLPVLVSYPEYCPYEVVYTAFRYGHTAEKTVEKSRRHLYAARLEGTWDEEMRPLRNSMSRARIKIQAAFGLKIVALLETGWLLRITN